MTERSALQSETAPSTPGSATSHDGTQDSTVSLQHYLQPLVTHRRVVAGVAILTMAIGLAIATLSPTSYTATTAVRVYPASAGPAAALSATSRTTDMETETRIATAHPVVEATASELQDRSIDVGTQTVRANLSVKATEDSGVLDITYRSSNPAVARVGSEVATSAYLSYRAELNRLNRDAIRQSITDRISELREELVDVENQLDRTQADAGAAIALEVERDSITGELTAQQRALAELSVLTADTAIVFDQAQEPRFPDGPGAPLILAGALAGGLVLGIVAAWVLAALSPVAPNTGTRRSLSANPAADQTAPDQTVSGEPSRRSSRVRGAGRDQTEAAKVDRPEPETGEPKKTNETKATRPKADKTKTSERAKARGKNRDKGDDDRELTSDELADWVDPLVAPLPARADVPAAPSGMPTDSPTGQADPANEELFDPSALETIFGGSSSASPVPPALAGVELFPARTDESAPGEAMFELEPVSEVVEAPPSLSPSIDEMMADEVADLIFGEADETSETGNPTGPHAADLQFEPSYEPTAATLHPPIQPPLPPTENRLAPAETAELDDAIEPDSLGTQTVEMFEPSTDAGPLSSADPRGLEPGPASWNGPFIGPVTWDDIAATDSELDVEPTEVSSTGWPEPPAAPPGGPKGPSTEGWLDTPDSAGWPEPPVAAPPTIPDNLGWPEPLTNTSSPSESTSAPGSDSDRSGYLEPPRQPVPDLVATEGFSALFQQLSHLGADGPVVAMSVGDSDSGAGLTVGFELADELRALGARVLLIDSLIDNPVLNRLFDERSMPGLAEVLAGHQSLQQVVRSLPDLPGLDLLTVGTIDVRTEALLQDQPLANILSEARLDYHSIVIIAGPVLSPGGQWAPGIDLIRGVARMVDGVIVGTRRAAGLAADPDLVDVLATVPAPLLQLITSSVGSDEASPVEPVSPPERLETPSAAVASGATAQMGL